MNESGPNTIILIICIIAVAFFAVRWGRGRMLRQRAKDWPTATGRVETSELRMERRSDTQSVHVAQIDYAYDVQGTAHHGVWKRTTILSGKAEGWIAKHPSGADICVRYDPNNPGQSVIFEADQL